MKTLWDKGSPLNEAIASFTVWDDRTLDVAIARHDVLGSLAHVKTLTRAQVLSEDEADVLERALCALYERAVAGDLVPGPMDEDIHSTVERLLTEQLGPQAGRLHTARSRNDQVAVDVAMWVREQSLSHAITVLDLAKRAIAFAQRHAHQSIPGMTHLQPAMPSSVGLWALGFASLLLDDVELAQDTWRACSACALGSAAGYGVPDSLISLDRDYTAELLGFVRPIEPVTSVQAGRGRQEASLLFCMAQTMGTLATFASDVVLYVNPEWGWLKLDDAYTTGSSIMPQKKNPDVMELIRGQGHGVRAALMEVMSLPGALPSGYHRDYQLLKAPLMRGARATSASLEVVRHVFEGLQVVEQACENSMRPELYATHRALELVASRMPFRDAYRQVAAELERGELGATVRPEAIDISRQLTTLNQRASTLESWCTTQIQHLNEVTHALTSQEPS